MLVVENSFKTTLISIKQVKATIEYIEKLKGSPIRLKLLSQDKEQLVFQIKERHESSYKTVTQWFVEDDFQDLLNTLQIKITPHMYVDEDAQEGYVFELNTKSLWDGERIVIKKGFWICGK